MIAYVVSHVPDSLTILAAILIAGRAFIGIVRLIDDCKVGPRIQSVQQPSLLLGANGLASAEGNGADTGAIKVGGDSPAPRRASIAAVDENPAGHPASNVYDWASEERAS